MLGHDAATFLAAGHETAKSLFPGILTMESVTYTVARSALDRVEKVAVGGFEPETTVAVRLLVAEVEGEPPIETVVDLDGETLRTKRVCMDKGGVTWYLELGSA